MNADPIAALPPAVRAFANRHGIGADAVRSGGRLTLTVDKRFRLHLQAATHNRVALVAQLMPMPPSGQPRNDQAIERLMKAAAGLMRDHPSTLCADPKLQSLLLQQTLPADADAAAVEKAVADFSNVLAFWSGTCAAESARL
jgi:hypothetical protein